MAEVSLRRRRMSPVQWALGLAPLRRPALLGLFVRGDPSVARAATYVRRLPPALIRRRASRAAPGPNEDAGLEAGASEVMLVSLELMAHDLRSPLAASRQAVGQLLRRRKGDEQALLAGLDEALSNINRMVEDLLDLERVQAASTLQLVEIDQIARDCVESCSAPELVEVLTVSTEVEADPVLVRTSIRNLLENALRHARTEVLLRAGPVERGVLVVVDDDGPGIPPDLREMVFRPLVRLDHGAGDGIGLGLTLVRRVAELHGGRVWAEPSPSGGARFCVWLPRRTV
jgi:signal transduction histidine kinase